MFMLIRNTYPISKIVKNVKLPYVNNKKSLLCSFEEKQRPMLAQLTVLKLEL